MFKGGIFKNLPELSLTRNIHWGREQEKAEKVLVTANISSYSVLKALRTQDAFFFSAPKKFIALD